MVGPPIPRPLAAALPVPGAALRGAQLGAGRLIAAQRAAANSSSGKAAPAADLRRSSDNAGRSAMRALRAKLASEISALEKRLKDAFAEIERLMQQVQNGEATIAKLTQENGEIFSEFRRLVAVFFKEIDGAGDRTGVLGKEELRATRVRLGLPVSDAIMAQTWQKYDSDGSSGIELDEFFGVVRGLLAESEPTPRTRK